MLDFKRKMLATETFIQFISDIQDQSGIETSVSDDCIGDVECLELITEELLLSEISQEIKESRKD